LSMLIFLGVQTAVDVNHLLPSMLIFLLLVTGPELSFQIQSQFNSLGLVLLIRNLILTEVLS
jgi:hypothetical protein